MKTFAVFQLIALTWLALAMLASLAASLASPVVRRLTLEWAPDARHRSLLALSLSPALLASAAVFAVLSPSLLAFAWPAFDHCLTHPGHVHLCFSHLPERSTNPALLASLIFAFTFLIGKGALGLRELWRASRLGSRLVANARPEAALGARILPVARPLCLLVGLFRPTLLVSRGLLSSISAEELHAVLWHERAHAARRDTLLRLAARIATIFMLPGARRSLLADLELSAEQSADEAGASALGDRLAMAQAILKVERLLQIAPAELGVVAAQFGGRSVPARVAALLDGPLDKRPCVPLVVGALLALSLLGTGPELHHVAETLLGFIAH